MHAPHNGLIKRVQEAAVKTNALKARLAGTVDSAQLPRLIDEMRELVDQLEVAVGDLGDALEEQHSRQTASSAAHRRLETLFRLAPTPCIGVDREGAIVEVNAAAADVLNVTSRHIIGRAFPTFVSVDRPGFLNVLRHVFDTGSTAHWSTTVRPRDKGPFSANILVAPDPPDHVLLVLQLPNVAAPAPLTIDRVGRAPSVEA